MGLLRKLRKNKEAEQNVQQPKEINKPTLTEKLGIPFGLNEIEYISTIQQELDEPVYYLSVSNGEKLKIMSNTQTNSKDEIIKKLDELKSHFALYGNFVNLGEGMPLVNLNRIKAVSLNYDAPDENNNKRNHVIIYLSNGQTFHTKPEIISNNSINKNEFIHFTFWSNRNERLYGK